MDYEDILSDEDWELPEQPAHNPLEEPKTTSRTKQPERLSEPRSTAQTKDKQENQINQHRQSPGGDKHTTIWQKSKETKMDPRKRKWTEKP